MYDSSLVEDNLRLVTFVIKKYIHPSTEKFDDYFQEGCYWLCLAAERFDESKGFAFSTFATNYIYRGIQQYIRGDEDLSGLHISRGLKDKLYKQSRLDTFCDNLDLSSDTLTNPIVVSLSSPVQSEESGDVTSFEDFIADTKSDYEEIDLESVVNSFLSYLGTINRTRDAKLFKFLYNKYKSGVVFTQNELASAVNMTQPAISRRLKKLYKLWSDWL